MISSTRVSTARPLWRKIAEIAAQKAELRDMVREREAEELRQYQLSRQPKPAPRPDGDKLTGRQWLRSREAKFLLKQHRTRALWAKATPTKTILAEVAAEHEITVEQLLSPSRTRSLSRARFKACWRIYDETNLSFPEIGKRMAGRDHTTILNGIRRYMDMNGITALPAHRSAKR